MKKFILLLFLTLIVKTQAQSKYVIISKSYDKVTNEVKKALQAKNYRNISNLINGYVTMTNINGKEKSFSDKNGNILNKSFDFLTPMTKSKIFFSGNLVFGRSDYGSKEVQKINDIKSYNSDGIEITTELSKKKEYYFATNQKRVYKFYSSKSNDYITIHKTVEEKDNKSGVIKQIIKEGLIDGKGKIIFEPEYDFIKQIYEDYFLIQKNKGLSQIIDLKENDILPLNVDEIAFYPQPKVQDRFNEYIVFKHKVILKEKGKYGIYNLRTKKWDLENIYNEIIPIIEFKQIDEKKLNLSQIMFIDTFIVNKDDHWGLINSLNEELIPFIYSKIIYPYLGSEYYTVSNKSNKINLYDVLKKEEIFDTYYDEIRINPKNNDIVVIKKGNNYAVLDKKTNEFLIDFSEEFKEYSNINNERQYIFKKINPNPKYPSQKYLLTLFSVNNKKIISKDQKSIRGVEWSYRYAVQTDFNNKKSIVDMDNNTIIVSSRKLNGVPIFRNGKIGFYSGRNRKKVNSCFSKNGTQLKSKDCLK